MIKVTTSDGVMTEFTDAKGFVDLGSFSDGEVGTVEIQGYNNLVKEFIFSSFVDYMALEMTPTVSKNSIGIFLYIFLKIFINKYALFITQVESRIGHKFSSRGYGNCESNCECLDQDCLKSQCECLDPSNE